MVAHGQDEYRLLAQGTLSRGWEDTQKCLTHGLFWIAEVGIGGTVAWAYGGGMALIFIATIFLSILIVAVATAPVRQRGELRRAFNVAAPAYNAESWMSLEKDFRGIVDTSVAASWTKRTGETREWNVWGDGLPRFKPLAARAGNMLLHTPKMRDFIAPEILADKDALCRWLRLLATDGTTREIVGSGHETDSQGIKISHESGGLKEPQERSANMCAEIAAKIT